MPNTTRTHCVLEIHFRAAQEHSDPFNRVDLDIEITNDRGEVFRHPCFWAGGAGWKARVALPTTGHYTYRTLCSEPADAGLHGQKGEIEVQDYTGENRLFKHGRIRVSEDKTHFEHLDGTPFFWLGDTWWMGLCARLKFPEEFQLLLQDRVRKGFNVVQIVAGPYPDMDDWDPRGENEAGFPFTAEYASIHNEYYDLADQRFEAMVQAGILPCILGMWGYYLPRLGVEKVKRYWRYIVARYGAYPVVWCLAGEGSMPYYLTETREEDQSLQEKGWSEVGRMVQEIDGFGNLVSIHPSSSSRKTVSDPSILDFEMLQTGHGDLSSVAPTAQAVIAARSEDPDIPVINSEVNYEGLMGRCWENIQRMVFYTSVFNGTIGHTYGANGVWQVNLPDQPYGPSPHGRCWGNKPWNEAYQLPGSTQTGFGRKLIERFPWWQLERHPEWVDPPCRPEEDPYSNTACGIPTKLRLVYVPFLWSPPKLVGFEEGVSYRAYYFDPMEGVDVPIGEVKPESDGAWTPPLPPAVHDWVVVLEAV